MTDAEKWRALAQIPALGLRLGIIVAGIARWGRRFSIVGLILPVGISRF